jgi:hypothetical protein
MRKMKKEIREILARKIYFKTTISCGRFMLINSVYPDTVMFIYPLDAHWILTEQFMINYLIYQEKMKNNGVN